MKKPLTYFIVTFGCQMNKADSEKIAAAFQLQGYRPASSAKNADVVVINTCSVRQSAEDRVLGLVHQLSRYSPKPKIILTGCMLRYTLYRLRRLLPAVDEFVPLQKLTRQVKEPLRQDKKHAWVPIMRGCNNFCTYCVVPYARGREVSRPFEEVVCEVRQLVRRGYSQVTLLGQNVNSYHKYAPIKVKDPTLKKLVARLEKTYPTPFALLLAVLNEIKGLKKIKFLTSNPQDMTDDIIQALKLPKVDRYLHLPVQSGDDQILKKMNRKYTAAQYLQLIKKIRRAVPDIKIGTDIIVGFPGETPEQFENTVKLCKKANFSVAYIAKYSPRPGTAAYHLKDDVPPAEKKRRWQILENLINKPKQRR